MRRIGHACHRDALAIKFFSGYLILFPSCTECGHLSFHLPSFTVAFHWNLFFVLFCSCIRVQQNFLFCFWRILNICLFHFVWILKMYTSSAIENTPYFRLHYLRDRFTTHRGKAPKRFEDRWTYAYANTSQNIVRSSSKRC